ncbi:hypothetical protein TNCT_528071 [Trichonephila clavata]|uniref:Uncharacterized protein n=1 Tax=Trichonephila clavata TaxID=2740835 RepID=A0A8X6HGH7_TRICU|nr:hypothetical protein TNCT_528071 [Trichonephila clavata]
MSDQNRKRILVTLLSFVKKIRKDEKQNTLEMKEYSRSTVNGLPRPEKVLDDDIQEKMKVSENLSYPSSSQNNVQTPVSNITVTDIDMGNYIKIKGPIPNLTKTAILCGKQGIALIMRKQIKMKETFQAVVKFHAEAGDDALEKHLKDSRRNTYINWGTQNEI